MNRDYLIKLKKKLEDKFIVCVTGIPGSGKSLFCSMLESMGAYIISCDQLASKLLTKKTCYSKILVEFGSSVFNGRLLDKKKLALAVFKDVKKRRWLEGYLHPLIADEIYSKLKQSHKKIAVLEVPLLFESGFDSFADLTVCVVSPKGSINSRLSLRGWSRKESSSRLKAQMSQAKKAYLSDLIVKNDGSIKELKEKAKLFMIAFERLT